MATLIAEIHFKQLSIHTAVQQVEDSWQRSIFYSDNKYVSWACGV